MADVVYLMPRWTQQDWMADAACKGQTAAASSPPTASRPRPVRPGRRSPGPSAARCPCSLTCREYARRNREQGYWGGENDEERVEARHRSAGDPAVRPPALTAPIAAEG